MNTLLLAVTILSTIGSLLFSNPPEAQLLPPAKEAAHVKIIEGPALELAHDDQAIVRWTISNPGGSDDHFGVVHFGTDAKNLGRRAESHIRLNRAHSETTFRVRISGLQPGTTYYYRIALIESDGRSDGVTSTVNRFTMPGRGGRLLAYPRVPHRGPSRSRTSWQRRKHHHHQRANPPSLLTIHIPQEFSRST